MPENFNIAILQNEKDIVWSFPDLKKEVSPLFKQDTYSTGKEFKSDMKEIFPEILEKVVNYYTKNESIRHFVYNFDNNKLKLGFQGDKTLLLNGLEKNLADISLAKVISTKMTQNELCATGLMMGYVRNSHNLQTNINDHDSVCIIKGRDDSQHSFFENVGYGMNDFKEMQSNNYTVPNYVQVIPFSPTTLTGN